MSYAEQESLIPNLLAELEETKEKLAAKEAELSELRIKFDKLDRAFVELVEETQR